MSSLLDNERHILERIVGEIPFESSEMLAAQIQHTTVKRRSATWVDLCVIVRNSPWLTGTKVIPVTGHVDWAGRFQTAVLALVDSDGYFCAIEHYWYTEEPTELPSSAAMRLEYRSMPPISV